MFSCFTNLATHDNYNYQVTYGDYEGEALEERARPVGVGVLGRALALRQAVGRVPLVNHEDELSARGSCRPHARGDRRRLP